MKQKPQPARALDHAELEQMVEPLTIHVSKMKNGQLSPIILPEGASGERGSGWSKGEVKAVEAWLVNDWSGGGMYEITVTDDTKPVPRKISWKPFWSTAEYPEKVPPTMASAMPVATPVSIAQPLTQQQVPMTQFPGGLPTGGLMAPIQQPQAHPQYYPQATPYMPYAAQMAAAQQNDTRRLEERLAAAEAQLMQSKLEGQARQYQADLERERASNAAVMQRLEARIAELSQSRATQGVTPEMQALQEQNRLMQQQMEADRREREAERRERELRDQMTAMRTAMESQIAAMQQQYQQMLLAQQNKGTDPILQLMMEQNRNSMEAMKEVIRQSSGSIDKFQAFMMSPRDVAAMQKDASQGLDAVTQKMANAFGTALDMQQKVLASALELNQGGSETVAVIREGIANVKDLADRYMVSETKKTQATQSAQAAAVQAQAQAAAIQAQRDVAMAQIDARGHMPQPTPRPVPAAQQSNGLSGPPQNGSFDEWQRKRDVATPPKPPRETVAQAGQPRAEPPIQQPQNGHARQRTDEEWFGPLIIQVHELRGAVERFVTGLRTGQISQADLNEGKVPNGTAGPEQVAQAVMQALMIVTQNQIPVPAVIELLHPGHLDAFMKVLLPNANENFHVDVITELKRMNGEEPDEEDDDSGEVDDDNDGENHDDVRDGSRAPATARA